MRRHEDYPRRPASRYERFSLALGGMLVACGLGSAVAPLLIDSVDAQFITNTPPSEDGIAANENTGVNPYYTAGGMLVAAGVIALANGTDMRRNRLLEPQPMMPSHDIADLSDREEQLYHAIIRDYDAG